MAQVRLAVIGAGSQCTNQLMPGLPYIPELELVAVCDLREELAARNARAFGAPAHYRDAETMLAAEEPDAVMVVGPPIMHDELGIQVLEAGCHLFCEKPSSPTVEGARRLAEAGLKAGKIGQVGHMMRHAEGVRLAKSISGRPGFGKLLSVESKYTTWPTRQMPADRGWGEPDEDWTYMLVQGGHPIDLIRHFVGPIVRVMARRHHGQGNAKVYQVTVEAADGTVGFLNLQDSYNGWSTKLELVGDAGSYVTVEDLGRTTWRLDDGELKPPESRMNFTQQVWEPHFTTKMGQRAGYQNQLQAFARFILNSEAPYPSLVDAWRNLVISEAILESCRSGQAVEVSQEAL